jgi:acid phosphatase family membrane protein YuiD
LSNHEDDFTNPHEVTAAQVGTYTSSQIDTSLSAKANATTVTTLSGTVSSHIANVSNPHSTTAAQVGLPTAATDITNNANSISAHVANTNNPQALHLTQAQPINQPTIAAF